jgi:lipoyl(octanoyl) transferase
MRHLETVKPMQRGEPVIWRVETSPVEYAHAVSVMEAEVEQIAAGNTPERVWLLEHPAVYTAGTSAKLTDLVEPNRFPVFQTGRGGQYTYHGPGQRVAYTMLDLRRRGGDVRAFVATLEQWLINTLAILNVVAERREDRVGVWVQRGKREDKIAALGIRVRRGISFHGVSLNINPDLSHFSGIIPCGVKEHGVTSLADLGYLSTMQFVDVILRQQFENLFGPTVIQIP